MARKSQVKEKIKYTNRNGGGVEKQRVESAPT